MTSRDVWAITVFRAEAIGPTSSQDWAVLVNGCMLADSVHSGSLHTAGMMFSTIRDEQHVQVTAFQSGKATQHHCFTAQFDHTPWSLKAEFGETLCVIGTRA